MPINPWLAIALSFGYVFVMLAIGEGLKRWQNLSSDFTRKFIHISVGMYSILAILLFERWELAIIPPAAFIIINFLDWKFGILQAMTSSDRSNLGTVYFPISFCIIIWVFWDRPELLVSSLMPLTWGDSFAAVIGKRFGRRTYSIFNSTRSLEGSFTMFLFSATSSALVLAIMGVDNWLGLSLAVGAGATLVEAVSPFGTDNLTIPAISALLLAWLA
jgi:phytol kinase